MVIRESAKHISSLWGVCKWTDWLFFSSLLWIRKKKLKRRIKAYYSTQGAAGVCKRERDEREEESKEHSVATEICIGVHCNHTNTVLLFFTGWEMVLHLFSKRENDNQTCTFFPYYANLRILIGCSVDDNYLLEYWNRETSLGMKKREERTKKKKSGGMQRR